MDTVLLQNLLQLLDISFSFYFKKVLFCTIFYFILSIFLIITKISVILLMKIPFLSINKLLIFIHVICKFP